jgi:hypothetical protein
MLLYNLLAISKAWGATMMKTPNHVPFNSEIWYFTAFRKQMDDTNYSAHGKVLLLLPRLPSQDHMSWRPKWHTSQKLMAHQLVVKILCLRTRDRFFSPRYYVIKVHDQYNKDDFSSPTIVLQNQTIPSCSQHRMRANRLTKPTLVLS